LIIVKIEKSFRGYGAYFKDSQGFKTIFSERNSFETLMKSIKDHMKGIGIIHYEIKKIYI